jgi:hypothetical protein
MYCCAVILPVTVNEPVTVVFPFKRIFVPSSVIFELVTPVADANLTIVF